MIRVHMTMNRNLKEVRWQDKRGRVFLVERKPLQKL